MLIRSLIALLIVFACNPLRISPADAFDVKLDFNGDGQGDLFVQNPYSGAIDVWLTNGSAVIQQTRVATIAPSSNLMPLGLRDMNGDGKTDLALINAATGALQVRLLNGGTTIGTGSLGTLDPKIGWSPVAFADFDADGRSDVLWRNSNTGELTIWLVNGISRKASATVATIAPATGWALIAVEDISNDGRADLLWRHAATGQLYLWLMNGVAVGAEGAVGAIPVGGPWMPFAIADLHGDGQPDIICYNYQNAQVGIWPWGATTLPTSAVIGTLVSGWNPVSLEDFNGDDRKDFLFYNATLNQYLIQYMNGRTIVKTSPLPVLAATSGWGLIGIDDFNGDGAADILQYNGFNYGVRAWIMAPAGGVARTPSFGATPVPSVWQIIG